MNLGVASRDLPEIESNQCVLVRRETGFVWCSRRYLAVIMIVPRGAESIACLAAVVSLFVGSCATVGVEGANIAKDEIVYQNNIDAARKGDPVSQFKVGDALCCSINEGVAFYNTPEAVSWLCLSARQGYGPAMLKVGRILSGDVVDGVRLARRIAHGVVGTTTNFPVAYAWLRAAEDKGLPDAKDRADALWKDMSEQERLASREFQSPPMPKACTWEEAGLRKPAQPR